MARKSPAKKKKTISLWAVIESMQRRLEGEGLDADVVDVAVTRGLEALLETYPRPRVLRGRRQRERERTPLFLVSPAKA